MECDLLKTDSSMGTRKKVCIIVVNFNGKHLLKDLLDSLIEKTTYLNYRLVLVDNGSTDGSGEFVEKLYPWIQILRNSKNLGFSRANNQGIKACNADYYLLLNTDMRIHTKGWLTNLVCLLESDKNIGIVTCHQPSSEEALRKSTIGRNSPMEVDFAPGSLMLIKKETIDEIGVLEEEFDPAYFEDTDFCCRALVAGWKIMFDPSTVVFHFGDGTAKRVFGPIPQYFRFFERNRLMFNAMNHSFKDLPKDLLLELDWLASALFLGNSDERKQKLYSLAKAYQEALSRMRQLIYKRRVRKNLKKKTRHVARINQRTC
jgi:GT2 family glycosyltransferase